MSAIIVRRKLAHKKHLTDTHLPQVGAYTALANQPFTPFTRVGRCVTHERLCKSPAAAAQVNKLHTKSNTAEKKPNNNDFDITIINVFLIFTIFIASIACCC